MKRVLLSIVLMMSLCVSVCAYDFTVDKIYYNILPTGHEVEVTHNGDGVEGEYDAYNRTRYTIPESVTYEGITYSVVRIGDSAFRLSTRLRELTLPATITSIGDKAFYFCTQLQTIEIPSGVLSIGEMAFFNCFSLASLQIPASVTTIGQGAFMKCTALSVLNIDANNRSYCCVNKVIYSKDKSVIVEALPTLSGRYNVPETVTRIEKNAFEFCTGLTEVNFNENLREIGDFAFYYCTGLTSLTLPQSLEKLGFGAFFFCDKVTSVVLNENLKSVGNRAFSNMRSLVDVEINGSNIALAESMFSNCIKLKTLTCNDAKIRTIEDFAFMGCSALTVVSYPLSLTSIGEYAFANCIKLRELTFGYHIENIADYAYDNTPRIRTINVIAEEPPVLYENTFIDAIYETAQLNVPVGCQSVYAAAEYWRNFGKMSEYDTAVDEIEQDENSLRVSVQNGSIKVNGVATDTQVSIYGAAGSLIYIATASQVELIKLPQGIYIVCVGNQSSKVAI